MTEYQVVVLGRTDHLPSVDMTFNCWRWCFLCNPPQKLYKQDNFHVSGIGRRGGYTDCRAIL
jgi:hypothetical protein